MTLPSKNFILIKISMQYVIMGKISNTYITITGQDSDSGVA